MKPGLSVAPASFCAFNWWVVRLSQY